jgi:hypothetical protein
VHDAQAANLKHHRSMDVSWNPSCASLALLLVGMLLAQQSYHMEQVSSLPNAYRACSIASAAIFTMLKVISATTVYR